MASPINPSSARTAPNIIRPFIERIGKAYDLQVVTVVMAVFASSWVWYEPAAVMTVWVVVVVVSTTEHFIVVLSCTTMNSEANAGTATQPRAIAPSIPAMKVFMGVLRLSLGTEAPGSMGRIREATP